MQSVSPNRAPRKRSTGRRARRNDRSASATHRETLAALSPGAPRELRITGDLGAVDSLDVAELERVARRLAR